jgi:hypothetical protein
MKRELTEKKWRLGSYVGSRLQKKWAKMENRLFPIAKISIHVPVTITYEEETIPFEVGGIAIHYYKRSGRCFINLPDGYKVVKED